MKEGAPIEVAVEVLSDAPGHKAKKQRTSGPGPFVATLAACNPSPEQEAAWGFEAYGAADPQARGQQPLYLLSRQPGANVIGSTHGPHETAADKATYAVGVYNRKRRTLRLMAAAGGSVVRLESQPAHSTGAEVAGLLPDDAPAAAKRTSQDLAARRAEARKLVEAFGSTRRKRQMKQREEAAVQVDRNADEGRLSMLMTEVAAAAAATGETRQEVMARVGAARVIPAHNPSARTAATAYVQATMFSSALLGSLNTGQLLHAAEKHEDADKLRERGAVPAYVLSRLQRINDSPDQQERKRRARCLALLAALLQLAAARPVLRLQPPRPATEEGGKAKPGGLEELASRLRIGRRQVLEPLLEQFYTRSTEEGTPVFSRDDGKLQLLLMHLLVVALEAEGWRMAAGQFEGLRTELKMSASDVVARFRELGCSCTATKVPDMHDGTPVTSYNVALLADGSKTLAESFPKPKTGPRQRMGGR